MGLFIPRAFVVYSSLLLIGGVGYFVSGKLGDFAQYSPFTYLDIRQSVNGEVATVLNNPGVTVLNGCIVLAGVSALLVGVGYGVLRLQARVKVKGASAGRLVVGD